MRARGGWTDAKWEKLSPLLLPQQGERQKVGEMPETRRTAENACTRFSGLHRLKSEFTIADVMRSNSHSELRSNAILGFPQLFSTLLSLQGLHS